MYRKMHSYKIIEIILIPVSIFALGAVLSHSINKQQTSLSKRLAERQEEILITQMVETYFQNTADILDRSSHDQIHSIILAKTRNLISGLKKQKQSEKIVEVLRFVSQAYPQILEADIFEQDPQSDPYFIDLSDIDFSDIEFAIMEIERAQLSGSNFSNGRIYNVACKECGLSGANFTNTDFMGVDFSDSDLTFSNFTGADIRHIHFGDADLSGATWTDGSKCHTGSIGKCSQL